MYLQVACVFIVIVGSALSSSPDLYFNAPNYIDFNLGGYDSTKEALKTQNANEMESSKSASKMESLLNLKRDIHQAYNLNYEIQDSEGRIAYREEFGDGLGLIKGSITSPKDNGDKTVINYIINVEQIPAYEKIRQRSFASEQMEPEPTVYKAPTRVYSESMDKDGKVTRQESFLPADSYFDSFQMRSSQTPASFSKPSYEKMSQRSFFSEQMEPEPTVYKAPTRVYSESMDKDGKVTRQESFLPADSDFDSFQMRSSQPFESMELPVNYKSYPEGIEWSKVQDVEDEENEKPLYVFHTKPAIKSFESSRDLDGNYKNVYPAQQGGYESQMFALN